MSILDEVLRQKEIYEDRYEYIKSEVNRLEKTDKKEEYFLRKGQLIEIEYVLCQLFKVY